MVGKAYLNQFLGSFSYPADAKNTLLCAYDSISADASLRARFDEAEEKLLDAALEREAYLSPLSGMAQAVGAAPQTIPLLCMISASETLMEQYIHQGIPMEIFRETMLDLHTKAMECRKMDGVYGVYGEGTPLWLVNYFRMQRFALGRLQYEIGSLKAEACTVGGLTLRKGDPVLCCHIPSNGKPFDAQTRLASYKAAFDFYAPQLAERYHGCVPITCDSWLLFPDHADMLGERSNIAGFMKEFKPLREDRMKTHTNLWRIFWNGDTNHPETLPENTGLERAYKQRLLSGGDVGFGYGIFLFDGKNIINS